MSRKVVGICEVVEEPLRIETIKEFLWSVIVTHEVKSIKSVDGFLFMAGHESKILEGTKDEIEYVHILENILYTKYEVDEKYKFVTYDQTSHNFKFLETMPDDLSTSIKYATICRCPFPTAIKILEAIKKNEVLSNIGLEVNSS